MKRTAVFIAILTVSVTAANAACGPRANSATIKCLNEKIAILEAATTPKGAVMAFNTESCPTGWKAFALARDRVIVGRGEVQALRTELGGPIKLTAENIPKLALNVESDLEKIQTEQKEYFAHSQGTMLVLLEAYQQVGSQNFALTANVGKDMPEPINFMPPAIALTMCEKK